MEANQPLETSRDPDTQQMPTRIRNSKIPINVSLYEEPIKENKLRIT
jgi:hypothetical protein